MPRFTRRDLLKAGLAASAGAVAADKNLSLLASSEAGAAANAAISAAAPLPQDPVRDQSDALSPRQRLLLDFGWRFHLGHANDPSKDFAFGLEKEKWTFANSGGFLPVCGVKFDDSAWKPVDLPHDWAVELPFVATPPLPDHGAKPLGRAFPETSIGWYRRVFDIPASDAGKRIALEFDGVFRHAMMIFNGHYLGENFSGYAPFRFDVTDFANYGEKNVLTVRADATLAEGWFYEGAGIYRHVWLTKTAPVHVAPSGVFVRSEVEGTSATVSISTQVENDNAEAATCKVTSRLVDAAGNLVATVEAKPATIPAWRSATFESQTAIDHPSLWSIEEPHLYRGLTAVERDGRAIDYYETTFGIRTIRFDPDQGFFLNGKPVKIKGTCNHQDHAGVGSALPDRLQSYRIERLKEMGCNAYRTSHNPPTTELLDACDRLGMLVMDETRMMSSSPEGLSQLRRLVRRDRNHPSVVIWSIGNEEPEQGTPRGARIAARMKRLIRELDPIRPITEAMNGDWGQGLSQVVDVQGFNYAGGGEQHLAERIDEFHRKFPQQPTVGSETGSTVSTRGIYQNDKAKGYVSAYDLNYPPWAFTAEHWWSVYDERPFLSGGFAWTGFDYRGEPTPYGWPCISSHFGILDTCGFPKDIFFYYQAWWGSKPVLHLLPHWNWSGKEGQEIDVWCFTNLDSVELFLNGKSLGTKQVKRASHLEWKVKYAPGTLEARGSKNGQVVLTDRRETTGAPAKLVLRPDRQRIAADGEDLSVITVEVVDAQGRVVPTASNGVSFKIAGPARLIGVGNGDPSCHEPDKPAWPTEARRSAFNGLSMAIVQALKQPGEIRVEASAAGLESASVVIEAEAAKPRPAAA
jgi:beta-galactosidase